MSTSFFAAAREVLSASPILLGRLLAMGDDSAVVSTKQLFAADDVLREVDLRSLPEDLLLPAKEASQRAKMNALQDLQFLPK